MVRPLKPDPVPPAHASPETPRTLAQEKSDFTAEGSPPPGQVAGSAPVLPSDAEAAAPPVAPVAPATTVPTGRRQPPSPAGPVRRSSKRSPAAWRGHG
ncbi:MAG: hypothetical protein Q7S90_06660 [Rubrivivax sp.]|nr:hypothetical protein [Rubrivivax sp.]